MPAWRSCVRLTALAGAAALVFLCPPVFLCPHGALAGEAAGAAPTSAAAPAGTAAKDGKDSNGGKDGEVGLELASALRPGESVPDGVWKRTIRQFGEWSLICDRVPARQVCQAAQLLRSEQGAATAMIAPTTRRGELRLVVSAPAGLDPLRGVRLSFGRFDTTDTKLSCTQEHCLTSLPFDEATRALLAQSGSLRVGWWQKDGPVEITGSLRGLGAALEAASREVAASGEEARPRPAPAPAPTRRKAEAKPARRSQAAARQPQEPAPVPVPAQAGE